MRLHYAISLWNYTHYQSSPSLERALLQISDQGFGVEIWAEWCDEHDLFDDYGRKRLASALQGFSSQLPVSLHSGIYRLHGERTFLMHQKQIDTAAAIGAEILVVHQDDFYLPDSRLLNPSLAQQVVDYAKEQQVTIALENGQLPFLQPALQQIHGLKFCLDVGHVYLTTDTMGQFLEAGRNQLVHLHLQDLLPEGEPRLQSDLRDHYSPGSGAIPSADWQLLFTHLIEMDFQGTAVFEIRPRSPIQLAALGKSFVDTHLKSLLQE